VHGAIHCGEPPATFQCYPKETLGIRKSSLRRDALVQQRMYLTCRIWCQLGLAYSRGALTLASDRRISSYILPALQSIFATRQAVVGGSLLAMLVLRRGATRLNIDCGSRVRGRHECDADQVAPPMAPTQPAVIGYSRQCVPIASLL
jgi:hypothetical protein